MTQFLTLLPLCVVAVGVIALAIIWGMDEVARRSRTPEPITDEQIHAIQTEPYYVSVEQAIERIGDWQWPEKQTAYTKDCRDCGAAGPYPQHPGICYGCIQERQERRLDK